MKYEDRIDVDPDVCHGQARIAGTRIPVSVVLDNLAAGLSPEDLLDEYPTLDERDVRAAMAYAADLSRDRIVDLPKSSG